MNYKLSRLFYNLKKFGFFKTVKKIVSRILRLDNKNKKSEKELYDNWISQNEPEELELIFQKKHRFNYKPKFSIVVPMFNTSEKFFLEMLNSVLGQTYSKWELCLADGSAVQNENIKAICEANSNKIKYNFLEENEGISGNTNRALEMATGDYIVFMDHDDVLSEFALFEIVQALNDNPDADFIYSDEDKIDENGERFGPYFKPDYSPETLECNNYITHLVAVKKSLIEKIGKIDSKFDGAQDFDFVLRATENAENIVHISKILYHWRAHRNSTANLVESKKYAYEAGVRVIEEHLKRTHKKGVVENPGEVPGVYKIKFELENPSKVSILIPNCDNSKLLKNCINSILSKTTYQNYEIVIIENNSKDEKTFEYYKKLENNEKIKVIKFPENGFNYSKLINFGVQNSDGEFILQLNNDTKVLTPDWLELFVGYAQNKEIGAVRSKAVVS